MAKAVLIFRDKNSFDDGTIVEIRIWWVLRPVPGSNHPYKYSFFFGRPGQRIVCYDNERGKGDHRHVRELEERYVFQGIDRLMADFRADVIAAGGRLK